MSMWKLNNSGIEYISTAIGGASLLAGSTNDNTAIDGTSFNRIKYDSGKLVIGYQATLTSGESLVLKDITYAESDDDSSFTTTTITALTTLCSGTSTLTAFKGTYEYNLNMSDFKKYLKFSYKPDLTKSATDVATLFGIVLKSGSTYLPTT